MKKVNEKPPLHTCPECESNNLIVTEETSFYLNGMDFFCHSVKAHDSNATVECMDCSWKGFRRDVWCL